MSNGIETKHDIEELEKKFMSVRGQLRYLRGRLDAYVMADHDGPVEGFEPKERKDARYMRDIVGTALMKMDGYEDRKAYNAEFESATVKLAALTGRL